MNLFSSRRADEVRSARLAAFGIVAAFGLCFLAASCALQAGLETGGAPPKAIPWQLGADVSALASGARGGGRRGGRGGPAVYRDHGTTSTEIAIMNAHGWNAYRLRVFLSPVRNAPNNSLENTIPIAKQIKAAGALFMLDIHYSDTWADPQHQETPVAWQGMSVEQIETNVESYTKDVISQLIAAGAAPDMVQVGNEITGGMIWPSGHVKVPPSDVKNDAGTIQALPEPYDDAAQWSNLIRYLKAGTKGVREATAEHPAKIIIHIDCGGDWPVTKWFFDHLTEAKVDYDIIGQSFYPRYHGTLELMQQNLAESWNRYHKPTVIAETGYPQSGGVTGKYMIWPATPEGQLQFMADLVNTVKRDPHAAGVYYWAPEGRGRGNAMWTTEGEPAPSMMVLDHLDELKKKPESKLPEAGATAKE